MCDNISIAEENIVNGEKVIRLKENIRESIVPFDLFKNGNQIASGEEFVNWIEDRIFQENRTDKKELLELVDLEEKDVFNK